jgi:DNA-binding transcriptional ArsR family regulator/2-polyprenyl-3-methyl-5-hydroxy-6-metoxy-1,4-benzoquinol methylase
VSADELQKIFRTLSDPTRVRILALLAREELAVQELMEALGMAQSRVSRHLAILREAGLLQDRRDGTYVFYHFAPPSAGPWHGAWELVRAGLDEDPTAERDAAALGRVLEARAARTRSFFDAVGPEWDALRKVFDDDVLRARAIGRLVDPDLCVVDVGTGTGILAGELRRLGPRVIAVDHSARMLEAARSKLAAQGIDGVELRRGEAGELPLADAEADAALAHMVLHYLPSPGEAIREMARVVKPGGCVVAVDFVTHEHEWMRHELGVAWLGFGADEVRGWFAEAGLGRLCYEEFEESSSGRDLPATFIASARKPR